MKCSKHANIDNDIIGLRTGFKSHIIIINIKKQKFDITFRAFQGTKVP